jgi:two-component system CheB/CheR fusion protein
MNEELQSAGEELQRSTESLQSMNQELHTVNAQLEERVRDLTTADDDLSNLLAATDIAAVFLDGAFRISRFTPAAARLLELKPADVGRPIDRLLTPFGLLRVADASRRVLTDPATAEHVVTARTGGRRCKVRILPYRRRSGATDGVVVTVVELSDPERLAAPPPAPPPIERPVATAAATMALSTNGNQPDAHPCRSAS